MGGLPLSSNAGSWARSREPVSHREVLEADTKHSPNFYPTLTPG
jgi:hypothetical protein